MRAEAASALPSAHSSVEMILDGGWSDCITTAALKRPPADGEKATGACASRRQRVRLRVRGWPKTEESGSSPLSLSSTSFRNPGKKQQHPEKEGPPPLPPTNGVRPVHPRAPAPGHQLGHLTGSPVVPRTQPRPSFPPSLLVPLSLHPYLPPPLRSSSDPTRRVCKGSHRALVR